MDNQSLYEFIYYYYTKTGKIKYTNKPSSFLTRASVNKSNFAYDVVTVDGKPVEVVNIKPSPQDKRRSQKLYKSPGVIRQAVHRGRTTKMINKALKLQQPAMTKAQLKYIKTMRDQGRLSDTAYPLDVRDHRRDKKRVTDRLSKERKIDKSLAVRKDILKHKKDRQLPPKKYSILTAVLDKLMRR